MTHPLQWWWDMKLSEQLKWAAENYQEANTGPEMLTGWAKRAEILEDTIRIGRYKFDDEHNEVLALARQQATQTPKTQGS